MTRASVSHPTAVGRDDGAAGMVTLFAVVLMLIGAVAGIAAAGDLSVTAARARSAADAAALAGIAMSPLVAAGDLAAFDDVMAGAAAREVAHANRARLVADDTGGWPLRYRVTVEVEPATGWVRRLVGPARAEAIAAVRPRLPPALDAGVQRAGSRRAYDETIGGKNTVTLVVHPVV